jgi:hypothetical protein
MMTAEEHLLIFEDAKRSGNTRSGLARVSNAQKSTNAHSPKSCGDNEAEGFVGLAVTARCGDAPTKPSRVRPILISTVSMRFIQSFPN